MGSWELKHNFAGDFQWFWLHHQLCASFRQIPSEDPANINERVAAANHADIMRAVADNVAFSAQHGGPECNGIERSDRRKGTRLRLLHHSPREEVLLTFYFARLRGCENGTLGSSEVYKVGLWTILGLVL